MKPEIDKQDVICQCSGTRKQQIEELIDSGIDNLDRISRITGAASGCGGCEYNLQQLLNERA